MSDSPALRALQTHCRNCGEPFGARCPAFCPACGQDTVLRPPKLSDFLQQFGGAFVSTEGALWRTLVLLLLRPGELTRRYLAGRRKHYVLPLRLYLTISVVVLLALRLMAQLTLDGPAAAATGGPAAASAPALADGKPRNAQIVLGVGRAGWRDGTFYCEQLPQWLCKRLQRRLDVDRSRLPALGAELGDRILGNLGAAMFVLLPAYALWLKLAYWNRRLRYTEHLVFALHVHAFWFAMLGLMLIDWDPLDLVAILAVPVYTLLAMKRVYAGRWWPLLARAAAICFCYGLTLVLAMTGLALWAVVA